MSCCGGGVRVVLGQVVVDGGAATGSLVMLVYTGEDRRNLPYVAEGKVYFFGNNERRRVNAVPARVAPQFLEPVGRYYGSFERWVEVESPPATGDGSAAASEPLAATEGPKGAAQPPVASSEPTESPTVTDKLDAAQGAAQPPVVSLESTGIAPTELTEPPRATESQGAAQAEPPAAPAKKKGGGHARA